MDGPLPASLPQTITLTSGLRGVSFGGAVILQDAGELVQFDPRPATSTLVSGLVPALRRCTPMPGGCSGLMALGGGGRNDAALNWGMDTRRADVGRCIWITACWRRWQYIDARLQAPVHASDMAGSIAGNPC